MKNPIKAAIIEASKTADAAKSFAIPAFSLKLGETKSTITSIAELIISVIKTIAIVSKIISHSVLSIFKTMDRTIATVIKTRCMRKLCSCFIMYLNPLAAYLKLVALFFKENGVVFFFETICDKFISLKFEDKITSIWRISIDIK